MKMKRFIISALLLCCALLCACGAGKKTDAVNLPAETPTASPQPTAAPVMTPAPMSDSDQRALIERSRSIWTRQDGAYETWFYAVTDLDHNGRLELITASLQGSGMYTYVDCWEVNPDFTGLMQCQDNTGEGQAWPDIIVDTLEGYYDPAANRYTYICEDVTRDGAARYYRATDSFSLQNGHIDVRALAYMEELYDAQGASTVNYYNASGSPVTEAEYNSAAQSAFPGQQKLSLALNWTRVDPQPTAQSPAYTAAPAYQEAAPVTITKHPTSESLTVGGHTWFIAHADNADTLTWEMVSPDGRVCSLNDAMALNPGLKLEVLEGDTIAVSNVPLSANGWGVQARFQGRGGSALTNVAMIYVSDYMTAYGAPISKYYRAYTAGSTDPGYAYENGISEFIGYSQHVGYALEDINYDGTPELIIAGVGTDDFSNGVLYDLYTLVNGEPVQLACSAARNRFYLRRDYSVLNEGSGGAGHSVFILNNLQGDQLVPYEAVITCFDDQPTDGYYHQTDGYSYQPRSYDEYLSEEAFSYYVGAWEESVYVPQLTQIA